MQAKIDPLTGGVVWEDQDKQEEEMNTLQSQIQKLTKSQNILQRDINSAYNPEPSRLTLQQRYDTIQSFAQECVTNNELMEMLKNKANPIAYDGFEPSGRMHIAQGILRSINVNKLVDAGVIFVFWVADWFALLNNKMGGDIEKIQVVGRYFIEVWKAAGMKTQNVKFLWASEEINKKANEYWLQVLNIARSFSVTRITRCQQIMGRDESGELSVAQMFYPCMQCNDIFFLKADICSLGMDQRKVNVLAREFAEKQKVQPPVIISHHMLSGLMQGQEKMSKSDPDSAIFMEDTQEDVVRKLKKAYCPEKIIDQNPILNYTKHIVFESRKEFTIERDPKWEIPNKTYTKYSDLEEDYAKGEIHPKDIKNSLTKVINELIEPVRQHFKNDPYARDLLQQIKSYSVVKK